MKPKTYSLTIPSPCNENWDDLTPGMQGRHCLKCQKTVTDFSSMSDQEIISMLNNNKNLCGRFHEHQLTRPLVAEYTRTYGLGWKNALLMAFLSLVSLKSFSIPQKKVNETTQHPVLKKQVPEFEVNKGPDKDTGKIIINGIVVDSETNEALPYAQIKLISNGKAIQRTITDIDGKFTIESIPGEHISLSINYIGYKAKDIPTENIRISNGIIRIKLLDNSEIMGVMTINPGPSLWQRFKNML